MKNCNRRSSQWSPWLKALGTGATRTLTWIAHIHSRTIYINAVTTILCEREKQQPLNSRTSNTKIVLAFVCFFVLRDACWPTGTPIAAFEAVRPPAGPGEDNTIHLGCWTASVTT